MSNEGALANLDDAAALDRIAAGTLSKVIAAELGVTPFGLRKRLSKHPDYKDAISQQAHSFVEDAMAEIFNDNIELDAVAIARARVRADTAFKYAKAHNPDYADKQQVTQLTINVTADLGFAGELASKARVFEHDSGGIIGGITQQGESETVIESIAYDASSIASTATDQTKPADSGNSEC